MFEAALSYPPAVTLAVDNRDRPITGRLQGSERPLDLLLRMSGARHVDMMQQLLRRVNTVTPSGVLSPDFAQAEPRLMLQTERWLNHVVPTSGRGAEGPNSVRYRLGMVGAHSSPPRRRILPSATWTPWDRANARFIQAE